MAGQNWNVNLTEYSNLWKSILHIPEVDLQCSLVSVSMHVVVVEDINEDERMINCI